MVTATDRTADPALPHSASFRDPSGCVFWHRGQLYRQVNLQYHEEYDHLISSGLYQRLTGAGWLIEHDEVQAPSLAPESAYKILRPSPLDFISYPYEWPFGLLKDAALRVLDIQLAAIEQGMTLKDASAYNMQPARNGPLLIDTLSFERYQEGRPWAAYRQFCQHFLAPLALMAKRDVRLGQLLRTHIDGVPLDLASRLLPATTWWRPGLLAHLHLHARAQRTFQDRPTAASRGRERRLSRHGLMGILGSLRRAVETLHWRPQGTEWADYYAATNYSDSALAEKARLVREYLELADPASVWDLGANTGQFSVLAAERGVPTLAFDIDPAAVELGYRSLRERGEAWPLPLLMDLTNPSPGLGWSQAERDSLIDRGPADCAMALALLHHLAVSNNVPLDRIAEFLARLCRFLIVEFVPKSDSQVQRLLASRVDIFDGYTRDRFEEAFAARFSTVRRDPIRDSDRTLYLMRREGEG